MGRVSQDTLKKLNAFIDSLPAEVKGKCALCNETLTHIVKKAEVETGAGAKTVCRAIVEEINEGAVPQDTVSTDKLVQRVRRHEGKDIITKRNYNDTPSTPKTNNHYAIRSSGAFFHADVAMSHLGSIMGYDKNAEAALAEVVEWCC